MSLEFVCFCTDSIDILKEVSFEETKAQVNLTIDSISNDISKLFKEIKHERTNSNSSEKGNMNFEKFFTLIFLSFVSLQIHTYQFFTVERTQYKEVLLSIKKRVHNTMNTMKRQVI
jgi:hypothetical protein